MKSIGELVKERRLARGWSQGELAQRLGYPEGSGQTTVSSWERGRTEPSREDTRRIAEVHEGRLDVVESRPGHTKFRVSLPAPDAGAGDS